MSLNPQIVTVGEILVEIMRPEVDISLGQPAEFVGPFPSGAPAICIDAAARLGKSAGIIGGVCRDEFGKLIIRRLEDDGVDVSHLKQVNISTGVAFVSYYSDGTRKFIYHMGNSAAGSIKPKDVPEPFVANSSLLHLSGSAIAMGDQMSKACLKAIKIANEAGVAISFDPNLRAELLSAGKIRKMTKLALRSATLLSPSIEELKAIIRVNKEEKAAERVLKHVDLVAVKDGSRGCRIYTEEGKIEAEAFKVKEIDPTGAGDAFSAAIAVGWLEGMDLKRLAYFANAAGARAVTAQGPMEGLAWRKEVDDMVKEKL